MSEREDEYKGEINTSCLSGCQKERDIKPLNKKHAFFALKNAAC